MPSTARTRPKVLVRRVAWTALTMVRTGRPDRLTTAVEGSAVIAGHRSGWGWTGGRSPSARHEQERPADEHWSSESSSKRSSKLLTHSTVSLRVYCTHRACREDCDVRVFGPTNQPRRKLVAAPAAWSATRCSA